jgi:hypothetical protein
MKKDCLRLVVLPRTIFDWHASVGLVSALAVPQCGHVITDSVTEYFVVQKIYNGWSVVGLFLPAAFLAKVTLAVQVRVNQPHSGLPRSRLLSFFSI